MSNYFNVCCKHTKNLEQKEELNYQKVGVVKVTSNGGWYLSFYHQPDVQYRVFSSREDNLPVIE